MALALATTPTRRDDSYVTRVMACLVVSLALANALLMFWPGRITPVQVPPAPRPAEMVQLEEVVQTTQVTQTYFPPPAPEDLLPIREVPDDQIIDDVIAEVPLLPLPQFDGQPSPGPPAPPGPPPPPGQGPPRPSPDPPPAPISERLVERPERSPRVIRQAFPAYPEAARREGIRARVRVQVVVSAGGQVSDAQIVARTVIKRNGEEEQVQNLPFGIDAAAIEAARRHLFRPARDGGEQVRARATLTLSFDPPRGG